MTVSIVYAVISRRFLGQTIGWVSAVNENLLLYHTFLAVALVLQKEQHIKIDLVLNRLGPRVRAGLTTVTSFIAAAVCFIIVWAGVLVTLSHFQMGYFKYGFINIPTGPLYLIIPIGCFLLFIQFLRRAYYHLRVWRGVIKPETPGTGETAGIG